MPNSTANLILGYGEIGQAMHWVIGPGTLIYDIKLPDKIQKNTHVGVMHVCFPYSDDFVDRVNSYIKRFSPHLVIVHSTTPIGTVEQIPGAVHSFVTGKHPNLESGIRTFTKYFGGERAEEASKIFSALGIKVKCYSSSRTTEAMKLWSTTYYFWNIIFEKEVYAWCEQNGLDFEAIYTESNRDYNEGYTKLGNPEFVRPNLKHMPGPVGGHCIIPNAKLLNSRIARICLGLNDEYAQEV